MPLQEKDSYSNGAFRYARPESYRTPLETLDGPVEVCAFVDGDSSWPEYVKSIWLAPGYLTDLREAYDRFLGPDYSGTVVEAGCGFRRKVDVMFETNV